MLAPDQARIHTFQVVPSLPEPLRPLLDIARNLWWSWHPEAVELFIRLDRDAWRSSFHNPIEVLGSCPQARLEALARDESYLSAVRRVERELAEHLEQPGWFAKHHPDAADCTVAYFCAEFGLTECLRIYSGGLGILAGDHLKSASELGLPLVGVGLLYLHGYFQQYLNVDGWQQEFYPNLDFANLPIQPVRDDAGEPLRVTLDLLGKPLRLAVWQARVGRVRLILLDTNLPENSAEQRQITSQLYGGDMDMRIRQEIVLGIGGMRALRAMGIEPSVYHLNEGHAAFLALEHIRMLIKERGISFEEARCAAAATHVFTTHTPVPAGIDRFPPDMIGRYFKSYQQELKLDLEGLLALGRENVFDKHELFSMATLAVRTSDSTNGVSKLHGKVSREMWAHIWPDVPAEQAPIGHVTNGVHARSWLSPDLIWLFDRYLPMRWQTAPEDQSVWEAIEHVPSEELWRIHERRRQKLVHWVRRTEKQQLDQRGASTAEMRAADELFNSSALTIGFARRFATYKRANLLFRDPERLMRILSDPRRPVQVVIAGKAHPADQQGKELIRQIIHFARQNGATQRLVFIENYNTAVARQLVQGVDVWLNTPRRGMEASGTSGMKAALNGVLNLSVLDGWWDEAYEHDTGWEIGRGEQYADHDYQDRVESEALYDLLEKEVVPMFYDRDELGLPRQWTRWMKNCIRAFAPRFTSNRMVTEYAERYYLPAHRRGRRLFADNLAGARSLSAFIDRLRSNWAQVSVESVRADAPRELGVREPMEVTAVVRLGPIEPGEVRAQVFYGPLDAEGRIVNGQAIDMTHREALSEGRQRYTGRVTVHDSGLHGFAVRIIPGHRDLATPFIPGLITWDKKPVESPKEPAPAEVPG